uniref:Vasculin n=1 Tax=Strix occidentalis caurina TaxID=311401 RepID=A0A8D0FCQ9_STROC
MAQHDFAPAWLNFPTLPSSTKSSLNFEKHSENFSWTENHYEANRRRDISSDGFDPNIGWPNGGHFGRKEKNGWRSQSRNGTENINHRGGYHGGGFRARISTFHCGKGQGLHENNVSDNETGKKEDKEVPKQFEAEDFPSLNPEYERTPNQNKSSAAGVWGDLFRCLTTLSVKILLLISNLNLTWCNLRSFSLVLSLGTWEKRPTPTSLQPPFREL